MCVADQGRADGWADQGRADAWVDQGRADAWADHGRGRFRRRRLSGNDGRMPSTLPPQAAGRKLVFLHLPKTGGTSLHHHFAAHFAPEEICPERFSRLHRYSPEELDRYRFFSGHFNFDQVRTIPGRLFIVTVLRDPTERLLSSYYFWKRHTADAIARRKLEGPAIARSGSMIDFLHNTHHEVQDSINNTMTRYLAGQVNVQADLTYRYSAGGPGVPVSELEVLHRAIGNLLSMDVIGFAGNLHEAYTRVALAFGMPRVAEIARLNTRRDTHPDLEPAQEEELSRETRAEIDRLTQLDRTIYRLARAHLRQFPR